MKAFSRHCISRPDRTDATFCDLRTSASTAIFAGRQDQGLAGTSLEGHGRCWCCPHLGSLDLHGWPVAGRDSFRPTDGFLPQTWSLSPSEGFLRHHPRRPGCVWSSCPPWAASLHQWGWGIAVPAPSLLTGHSELRSMWLLRGPLGGGSPRADSMPSPPFSRPGLTRGLPGISSHRNLHPDP